MYTKETELFHYGIKGMHWGIRRYQNQDGSYTQAGKERYNKAKDKYDKAKSEYKSGNMSKEDYTREKDEYKSEQYKYKQDIKADRGEELTKNGHGKGMVVGKYIGKGMAASFVQGSVDKVTGNKIRGLTTTADTAYEVQNFLDTIYDWQAINLYRNRSGSSK